MLVTNVMKRREPTYKENKFRAFIKRSSEPLLGMQAGNHHQHQVRNNGQGQGQGQRQGHWTLDIGHWTLDIGHIILFIYLEERCSKFK